MATFPMSHDELWTHIRSASRLSAAKRNAAMETAYRHDMPVVDIANAARVSVRQAHRILAR